MLQMSKIRSCSGNNSGSNDSSRLSLQTCVPKAANEFTIQPFLGKPTPTVAANPANWEQSNMDNQTVEDNCEVYSQHHQSQVKYSNVDIPLANNYNNEH
jgi:hypothetical protein